MLLGHSCVCAVEIEPYCRKVLIQRQRDGCLPRFPIWDDITTFDGTPWRDRVDIVCGGFPCQDISAAGAGAGIGASRSGLWKHMARVIGEIRPRYAWVENSPLLVGRGLVVVLSDLAEMGYDARWGIVGARHAKAPHTRDRIWILANARHMRGRGWAESTQSRLATTTDDGEICHSLRQRLEGGNTFASNRSNAPQSEKEPTTHAPAFSDGISDAASIGQSRQGEHWFSGDPEENIEGEADHALSERIARIWGIKSRLGRVANGVAHRMDRLKATGNGQVASVVPLAWKSLMPT